MTQPPENYPIESTPPSPDDSAQPRMAGQGIPRPSDVEPLAVEPIAGTDPASGRSSVKTLDVCPNCGASMRGTDQLVCIRCGFDLKTMRAVETKVGEIDAAEVQAAAEATQPLIRPGNGDFWLPTVLACAGGLMLLVGYFAKLPGLFPIAAAKAAADKQAVVITFLDSVQGVLRAAVLVGVFTACGMGALMFLASMLGRKTGKTVDDLKLGAMRLLSMVLITRLVTIISLPPAGLEWIVETIVQLIVFWGLSISLFRLKPRDAATFTGAAVLMIIVIWAAAWSVIWATGL